MSILTETKAFCPNKSLSWPYLLALYIIPFNIVFDFLSIFYAGRAGTLAIIRGLILVSYVIIVHDKILINRVTISIFILIGYTFILLSTASDLLLSINISSKIFISLLMLPIGYSLVRSKYSIDLLNKNIFIVYLIIILGFLLYYLFDIGGYAYVDVGLDTGGMSDNWNVLTYSLLLAPLYLNLKERHKKTVIFYCLFVSILIILLISFKRIAIAGLIFGYLIFFYKYSNYRKSIQSIMLVAITLIALSSLYMDAIYLKYKARQGRFDISALIEKEARSRETSYIWKEIFSFENPAKSLFGGEAFNSVGKYAGGTFGRRNAHVDYNLILISNGIVGLLLYLNIYFQIYLNYIRKKKLLEYHSNKIYISMFWALFLTSLFTSIAGQMYAITFRSIIFLYIGAILGYLSSQGKPIENHLT